MKKIYFSMVLIAVMIAGAANAQHVNIGVKGGLNLYTIKNDNGAKYDSKAGFNLGLLGHIHLNKQFALQPELVFSTQGAKYSAAGTETKLNLGYINVPVLLEYMFDNGFRLEAGPQVGFLASANAKTNNNKTDVKDSFKNVDLGLAAGVSYVNPASGFGVDLRYNFGLSDINESSSVKSMNRGGQLGVFYLFDHK